MKPDSTEISSAMSFPPQTPTETFPYRIEEQIGSGSMGIVYRAVVARYPVLAHAPNSTTRP